jgi:hypothetical protein
MKKRHKPCKKCTPLFEEKFDRFKDADRKLTELEGYINILEQERDEYKAFYNKHQKTHQFEYEGDGDPIEPEHLRFSSFTVYLENLLIRFPILAFIFGLFLSKNHVKKMNDPSTNPKWSIWSIFYRSWIADVLLRAQSSKTVRRTSLLLSAYMLLGNISEPCWRLLSRLRVLVSKNTLEKWVEANPKSVQSDSSFLFYVFDNCDMQVL